jgi:tetratricopeptide (TPR) repeat protein
MTKYILNTLIFLALCKVSFGQSDADSGYYYFNKGDISKAIEFFDSHVLNNPNDYKIRLQLGYIYYNQKVLDKALAEFEYVAKNSFDEKEIQDAKSAADVIRAEIPTKNKPIDSTKTPVPVTTMSYADSGYYYYKNGNMTKAVENFEAHLKLNPNDSKSRLQLAYIYYNQKKFSQSLTHFDYVGNHSNDQADVQTAKSAAMVIRDEMVNYSKSSLDLYFYNFYDSYQDNYIANFVGHYNFRMAKSFYTGFYIDLFTDSKSKPGQIYNDRFVEIGGFFKYNILDNLIAEFRLGYARQIDLDSSKLNVKPMLIYFNRIGDAKIYVGKNAKSKTSMYLDMYYAAMYDTKYQNSFLQISFWEAIRFHTGGYSYIESYLVQTGQFDSRRLDYNNYVELGTGLRFKFNLPIFPIIFIEPTYKVYYFGEIKNSFQIKAGFYFIYRTKL